MAILKHHPWIAAALCAAALGAEPAPSADEYQVKAAFLYNFAKFVAWPQQAFKNSSEPFTICILGRNPFGDSLQQAVRGKFVDERSFQIVQISQLPACHCHILFVGESERKKFRAGAGAIKGSGILVVGDTAGFAAEGGVINFRMEDGKIRFEINVEAAGEQQLHISSKLLSLAQIVRN